MEIANFVKSVADKYRYGIDCTIDNDYLLTLALSSMPIDCRESLPSCNDETNNDSVVTITCDGGNITIESDIVNTNHIINQIKLVGVSSLTNVELITQNTLSGKVSNDSKSFANIITTSAKDTVTDGSGNTYDYVTIGEFDWLTTNLRTTKLNDGTNLTINVTPNSPYNTSHAIPLSLWQSKSSTYYSWYDNNSNYASSRGALYNSKSAHNPLICPKGWRVPTYNELLNMINSNNDFIRSTSLWSTTPTVITPNGFNLIPNGYKVSVNSSSYYQSIYNAKYYDLDNIASLWTLYGVIQLDDKSLIPIRPNIEQPTAMSPQNITDFDLNNGRGSYNNIAVPPKWYPVYTPEGNCIRCMRNKK